MSATGREHVPEGWAINPAGWWKLKQEVESMSDDELLACGLRRARWKPVCSLDVRKGDRVRWPHACGGIKIEATVAEWLDGRTVLMEDGSKVDPTCDTRWERLG